MLTQSQVLARLNAHIARHASAKEWCEAHGLTESYVSEMRSGRRDPGPKLLAVLGLRRVLRYEPVTEQ